MIRAGAIGIGAALALGAVLFACHPAHARDAYTAAVIECVERLTAGNPEAGIDVDAVVLRCLAEAQPLEGTPPGQKERQ